MKSLQARFEKMQNKQPNMHSIACFAEAIMGQNFNPAIIAKNFNRLVDKDDYCKSDKKFILSYLQKITKPLEAYQKSTQIPSQGDDLKEVHVR